MYRVLEWGAETVGWRHLRTCYRTRTVLRGRQATLDGLVQALDEASAEPDVQAVDLLVNPHGTSRKLWFDDGPVDAGEVCALVRQRLEPTQRRRLRAVFSTACYGMTHNDAWLRAGFRVSVGSRGIYADGVTSLPSLLGGWAHGSSVQQAADAANASWGRERQDALAARYYRRAGRSQEAAAVDSTRVVDGARSMALGSDPSRWRPKGLPA